MSSPASDIDSNWERLQDLFSPGIGLPEEEREIFARLVEER
jgi:hypothetical protein